MNYIALLTLLAAVNVCCVTALPSFDSLVKGKEAAYLAEVEADPHAAGT